MLESPISLHDTATIATSVTPAPPVDPTTDESPKVLAHRDMFFVLSVYTPPKPLPAPATQQPSSTNLTLPPAADPPSKYDHAIARVKGLASFLTPSMRCTLTSLPAR